MTPEMLARLQAIRRRLHPEPVFTPCRDFADAWRNRQEEMLRMPDLDRKDGR